MALELDQESVAPLPCKISDGLAENVPVGTGFTVTVVDFVTFDPTGPSSVSVYVVVAVGLTVTEPEEGGDTPPTPLSILAADAFVLFHDKIDEPPAAIVAGLAVKDPVAGELTDTVAALWVVSPPAPTNVNVYVVVAFGVTVREPPDTGVTDPIPLSMDALRTFELCHESVDEPPCTIDVGDALRPPVGGNTVMVAELVAAEPATPRTVRLYVVVALGVTATEPLEFGVIAPIPLSIDALIPLVLDQDRVAEPPGDIALGVLVSEAVGATIPFETAVLFPAAS